MKTYELLDRWLTVYEKDNLKPRTYARYHGLIDAHITPCIGDADITQISRREVQDFLVQQQNEGNLKCLGQGLSAVSINLMLNILQMAFEYACDMEWIENNPCTRIQRIPIKSKKVQVFTKEEQRRLETAIIESNDARLFGIFLCLYTGLRIGELLALEWNDIDMERGLIYVRKTVYRHKDDNRAWQVVVDVPKTPSSERIIPLPSYILEMLEIHRRGSRSEFVIENKKGERMATRSYQYLFERLTQTANVPQRNFHTLRHTFATRALECGMDIKTLSEIMGHQNATITLNLYGHSMMETKIQMMNRLPKNF